MQDAYCNFQKITFNYVDTLYTNLA